MPFYYKRKLVTLFHCNFSINKSLIKSNKQYTAWCRIERAFHWCQIYFDYLILNVFNTDPKSAALKNAMAKRRYNAVTMEVIH